MRLFILTILTLLITACGGVINCKKYDIDSPYYVPPACREDKITYSWHNKKKKYETYQHDGEIYIRQKK